MPKGPYFVSKKHNKEEEDKDGERPQSSHASSRLSQIDKDGEENESQGAHISSEYQLVYGTYPMQAVSQGS